MNYETAKEIEIRVARHFGTRRCLIVPNVSWGLFNYECDMIVLTPARCVYEVEIKVNKHDLINDKNKKHSHNDDRIKFLYFAIPEKLEPHIEHIPERAGILVITKDGYCKVYREPKPRFSVSRLTDEERFTLARLGTIRIWNLKEKIRELENKIVIQKPC